MLLASSASSGGSNSNFLIPNGTFFFELVMFLIVLGVVTKFILPPLQKVMADRDATIRQSAQASDEGHHEAERLEAERQSLLSAAHVEARQIIEAATHEVEQLREDAQHRGQAEFERAIAAAQETIADEARQLREEALVKLDGVVIAAAERIIGVDVDPAKHREAISTAILAANEGEPA